MDDNNNNIFEALESPTSAMSDIDLGMKSTRSLSTTSMLSVRRSHLPLMNAGNGSYSSSSSMASSSNDEVQRLRRKDRVLHDLGFVNPGPKNLVNVANVPARRPKTRQAPTQEKASASKPLYDKSGLFESDQTDRCDCNRLKCPGCFLPCSTCQSSKCGLECRNLRTYSYEYRLYEESMLVRKAQSKKKSASGAASAVPLDSSLTSIEWLPNMQIGETSGTPPAKQTLPVTSHIPQKIEATEVEMPTTTVHDNLHAKPPYSYVTLIRQAILSTRMQRMTLNEIYQWIVDSYPYFRTAPPKWKNSIRHNLSLNKCFKRLQRSTNDPGKGSYWAVDESTDSTNSLNSRKRKFDEMHPSIHVIPASPAGMMQQQTGFYTNNNPMICGDISSVGGQSSSTDESDSRMSLVANPPLLPWDDLNVDLTASFRRFREQVLDAPANNWSMNSDAPAMNPVTTTTCWSHDLFPHGDPNGFLESIKLASSGEINWNDVDVKPYCEFLDGFRTNSSFQQQDRDKLINLASSLSSFFDHTGITNFVQSRIANESFSGNRLLSIPNRTASDSLNNSTTLPVVLEEEPAFDWDSIT